MQYIEAANGQMLSIEDYNASKNAFVPTYDIVEWEDGLVTAVQNNKPTETDTPDPDEPTTSPETKPTEVPDTNDEPTLEELRVMAKNLGIVSPHLFKYDRLFKAVDEALQAKATTETQPSTFPSENL